MITARKVSVGPISCLGKDPIGINAMESLWERARPVVRGLAIWVMLAGAAIAQDGGSATQPATPNGDGPNVGVRGAGQCCGGYYAAKQCRQCGDPQVNLALRRTSGRRRAWDATRATRYDHVVPHRISSSLCRPVPAGTSNRSWPRCAAIPQPVLTLPRLA